MPDPLIFIIDDDPVFSSLLNHQLKQSGFHHIDLYSTGEECLHALKKLPKVVFLDFNLEGLNGLETLLKIKEDRPGTKVFLMSSELNEAIRKECLQKGASLYLNKIELIKALPTDLLEQLAEKN